MAAVGLIFFLLSPRRLAIPRDWARVASAPPRSMSREVVDAPLPATAVTGDVRRGMPNGPTAEADLPGTRGVANASDNGRRQMEKMAMMKMVMASTSGHLKSISI